MNSIHLRSVGTALLLAVSRLKGQLASHLGEGKFCLFYAMVHSKPLQVCLEHGKL